MDPEDAYRAAASIAPHLGKLGGPLGLAGRLVGLGSDELEAGIPSWALLGVGVGVGAVAMYFLKDRVQAFVDQ